MCQMDEKKKEKEKSRKWESVTSGMEESGRKFPPFLNNSVKESPKSETNKENK